ncbi:MAG: transposase [Eubacteriaceae bacterium]|nr:transposase [Eubacteriaceae bacterium]
MRKKYSPEFKAKVMLEILRGEQTLNEASSSNGVHPNMAAKWKKEFVANSPQVFSGDTSLAAEAKKLREELDEACRQLGEMAAKYEWIKKYGA